MTWVSRAAKPASSGASRSPPGRARTLSRVSRRSGPAMRRPCARH
jgi:hypothetical protein